LEGRDNDVCALKGEFKKGDSGAAPEQDHAYPKIICEARNRGQAEIRKNTAERLSEPGTFFPPSLLSTKLTLYSPITGRSLNSPWRPTPRDRICREPIMAADVAEYLGGRVEWGARSRKVMLRSGGGQGGNNELTDRSPLQACLLVGFSGNSPQPSS
jgi:hypothetical protein